MNLDGQIFELIKIEWKNGIKRKLDLYIHKYGTCIWTYI